MGKVYHMVNRDLYIDVGLKFPVVVTAPLPGRGPASEAKYRRGSEVRILLKNLELSDRFLGYDHEITVLETDGILLGPHKKGSELPPASQAPNPGQAANPDEV